MTMQAELEALLIEMGEYLEARGLGPVDLYLLGGCALVLFDDRPGATKDLDAVAEALTSSAPEAAALLARHWSEPRGARVGSRGCRQSCSRSRGQKNS